MVWLGLLYIAVFLFEWIHQRRSEMKMKDRIWIFSVSFLLLLIAGFQYYVKNYWNLPVMLQAIYQFVAKWI